MSGQSESFSGPEMSPTCALGIGNDRQNSTGNIPVPGAARHRLCPLVLSIYSISEDPDDSFSRCPSGPFVDRHVFR
jgi:hypothetical protein